MTYTMNLVILSSVFFKKHITYIILMQSTSLDWANVSRVTSFVSSRLCECLCFYVTTAWVLVCFQPLGLDTDPAMMKRVTNAFTPHLICPPPPPPPTPLLRHLTPPPLLPPRVLVTAPQNPAFRHPSCNECRVNRYYLEFTCLHHPPPVSA